MREHACELGDAFQLQLTTDWKTTSMCLACYAEQHPVACELFWSPKRSSPQEYAFTCTVEQYPGRLLNC